MKKRAIPLFDLGNVIVKVDFGSFLGWLTARSHSGDRAKAEAFWSALAERRKQPGNCVRCGKPNAAETRQCPKCLAYQAKYRGRLQDKNEKLTAGMVVAIVKQCRREVTKLREIIKQMQRAHRAKNHRQWQQKRTLKKYADAYPEISKQELSQINHAYEAHED